ncbi:MAG TPA: hypothetical protein VFI29_14780 [Hanamia sp.]|nr:hypothetical protein [Hanamia sp.]
MKLFIKKIESSPKRRHNAFYNGLQRSHRRLQGRWADGMARLTKNFSRQKWMVSLILFVLLAGTVSVYVAVNSFIRKENHSILIIRIKTPKYINKTGETNTDGINISAAAFDRIKKFRVYMDSLARSPAGKILYDSIVSKRPGLMDSVVFIENYYQQLKEK